MPRVIRNYDWRNDWREQPCWTCEKACNSKACPWAGGEPRDDWTAVETVIFGSNGEVRSYDIMECPGYVCDVKPHVEGLNPTEAQEQSALVRWAELMRPRFPELVLLAHVPNEGLRSPVTGARLKVQGMKRGFPDLILPVPRGEYHGLFIEMKRVKGSKTLLISHASGTVLDVFESTGFSAFLNLV